MRCSGALGHLLHHAAGLQLERSGGRDGARCSSGVPVPRPRPWHHQPPQDRDRPLEDIRYRNHRRQYKRGRWPGTRSGGALTCASRLTTLRTAWCCSSAPDTTSPRRCGGMTTAASGARGSPWTGAASASSTPRCWRWSVVASCCGLSAAERITKSNSSIFPVRFFLLPAASAGRRCHAPGLAGRVLLDQLGLEKLWY